MKWHGYIGVENLNLTVIQALKLTAEFERLGPSKNPQPAKLCHWRTRLDNQARIYEALFLPNNLTVAKTKRRLGIIFGVSPATIGASLISVDFAGFATQVITFSRSGTDYLRMAIFGGSGSSYAESQAEVKGYLVANSTEWEIEPEA